MSVQIFHLLVNKRNYLQVKLVFVNCCIKLYYNTNQFFLNVILKNIFQLFSFENLAKFTGCITHWKIAQVNEHQAFSFSFSFWDCLLSMSGGGSARLVKSMSTYWVLSSAPWMTNAPVDVDGVSFRSKSTYIRPSLFTVWNKA